MNETDNESGILAGALVAFGAMTHGRDAPDVVLQKMADAFAVATVAIGRIDAGTKILTMNKSGLDVRGPWAKCELGPNDHFVLLCNGKPKDVLIVQTAVSSITEKQRGAIDALAPFLAAFWAARPARFDASLDAVRIEGEGSILHPDNPYDLTRAQLRICAMIAQGMKPKDMATALDVSIATVRTHLSQIYTKTGLDGMLAVMHHLQVRSRTPDTST